MLKLGDGNCIVSLAFDILPSFLPLGTSHVGPPDYKTQNYTHLERKCFELHDFKPSCLQVELYSCFLTSTIASLAAKANISAQETTPGQ